VTPGSVSDTDPGVALKRARTTEPSRGIKLLLAALRERRDALIKHNACSSEWRRLQFDAVSALVEAQRAFVDVHSQIVGQIGRDRPLYAKLRLESLEVLSASEKMRQLIREIERVLVEH
jgi:hypothetical protein